MPYLLACAFTDVNGGNQYSYYAFSSEDPNRSNFKIRKDVYYQIGFQESHISNKNTLYGYLVDIVESSCGTPSNAEDTVKCVIGSNRQINQSYSFLRINEEYSSYPSDGTVRPIPHFFVQPNLNFDTEGDSSSDSDSDSSDD